MTAVVSFADDPANNVWTGGEVFLAAMSLMFGLSTWELWRIDRELARVRTSVATAAGPSSACSTRRAGSSFMIDGQEGDVFKSVFGSQVTTIVSLVFLVVIWFSMSDTQQRGDDRGPAYPGRP